MPVIPLLGSSTETLDIERQQTTEELGFTQAYQRAMLEANYGHSLTEEVFSLFDAPNRNKGAMLTAEQANDMYPKDIAWDKDVATGDAIIANEQFRDHQKLQEVLNSTNVSGINNIASLGGMLIGGIQRDPIMMGGAMLSGMAFTATAGAGMSASIYNASSALGASWARAAAATALTEAAGSMLFDIPALLVTQALVNSKQSTGVQMSIQEVGQGVLMGAAFAGSIGSAMGAASRKSISASAAGMKKAVDIQAELASKGISSGADDVHFSMTALREHLSPEGRLALSKLDTEGFVAIGKDGRIYSNVEMLKQMRNLDIDDVVQLKDATQLTRRDFIARADAILGDMPNKGLVLEMFNRVSPFDIYNKVVEIPETALVAFNKVIDELKANNKNLVVDDLQIGRAEMTTRMEAESKLEYGEESPIRGTYTDELGKEHTIWNRARVDEIMEQNETIAGFGNTPEQMKATGDAVSNAMRAYADAEDSMLANGLTNKSVPVWESDYPLTARAKMEEADLGKGFKEMQDTSSDLFHTDLTKTMDKLKMDVEALAKIGQKFKKDGSMRKGGLQDRNIKGLAKTADMKATPAPKAEPVVDVPEIEMPSLLEEAAGRLDKVLEEYRDVVVVSKKSEAFAGLFKLLDDCK